MVRTTKGGRNMNPADAFRKEQRKKEVARNKLERKLTREAVSNRDKPEELRKQLQEIIDLEEAGTLNKAAKLRKKVLQDAYEQSLFKKKEEEAKAAQGVERPEDSRYYHPILNPTGAPPPGKQAAGLITAPVAGAPSGSKPALPVPKPPPLPAGPAPKLPPPPSAPPLPTGAPPALPPAQPLPPPPGPPPGFPGSSLPAPLPPPAIPPPGWRLPPPTAPPPGALQGRLPPPAAPPPPLASGSQHQQQPMAVDGPGGDAPHPVPPPPVPILPPPSGPPPGHAGIPPPPGGGPYTASAPPVRAPAAAAASHAKGPATITGTSTVAKRTPAHMDKSLTSLVPASVLVRREREAPKPARPAKPVGRSTGGGFGVPALPMVVNAAPDPDAPAGLQAGLGGGPLGGAGLRPAGGVLLGQPAPPTRAAPVGVDTQYQEFMETMRELGAL